VLKEAEVAEVDQAKPTWVAKLAVKVVVLLHKMPTAVDSIILGLVVDQGTFVHVLKPEPVVEQPEW
jgi:hypothetical protein